MDQISAHHLSYINAFIQYQSSHEDDSLSQTSNMSGTFNKLNSSLKMKQRKKNKESLANSEKQSVVTESEWESSTSHQNY